MSISRACRIIKAILCGIVLLTVSTSCQRDRGISGKDEEVTVVFQRGCIVWLAGKKYNLSNHVYGAWGDESEFARIEHDLQKYDKDKTRFFIDADREMTHMEFHTCMMGFTCGPFKMYRRNENMHNIAVHAIPLEASWCYRAVDKKDGAYYSFVLCDDKPFSRWDESVRVTEQEGFIDGIDRMLAVCRKSPELPYQVPAACPLGQAGPQVTTPEEVVTVPVFGVIGGIGGGIVGGIGGFVFGAKITEKVYDWAFTPLEKEEWEVGCEY